MSILEEFLNNKTLSLLINSIVNKFKLQGERLKITLANNESYEGNIYSIDSINFEYLIIAIPRIKQKNDVKSY